MKVEMLMPQMGESITEATVLRWKKKVGERVEKDETLLEISTDKVDSEVPATASGVIVELRASEEQTVPVKTVIAVIDTEAAAGSVAAPAAAPVAAPKVEEVKAAKPVEVVHQVVKPVEPVVVAAVAKVEAPKAEASKSEVAMSPVVKTIAAQNGITEAELAGIKGSGAQGRVMKEDILEYIAKRTGLDITPSAPVNAAPATMASAISAPVAATASTVVGEAKAVSVAKPVAEGTTVVPMDRMRKAIAKHMVESKHTSPHVYTVAECDITNVGKWRAAKQAEFTKRTGFKLSYTPFILEATVKALSQFPYVNASVDGDNIILKKDINLGCAVSLGNTGLVVPVIKKADQLNFIGLSTGLNDIANRARTKQLKPDDTQGGTFTVTNPGIFGSIFGLPIISQPQLAILGVGAIKKRPVVVDDMIAIRDMLYLTLSYDHRVIDGSMAGQFLNTIAKTLEAWDLNREL